MGALRGRGLGLLLALPLLASAQEDTVSPNVVITREPVRPHGCQAWATPGMAEGPISIDLGDGDVELATGRRACPRTEIGIGGHGGAIIDTPNFYGALSADSLVFGSYQVSSRAEVFGSFETTHWEYVQNASLKTSQLSLGQLTAGGTYVFLDGDRWVASASGRLMFPTSTAGSVRTAGGELGVAATMRQNRWLDWHGYAGADLSAGLSVAPSQPRVGFLIDAGAQLFVTEWFAAVLDLNLHLGSYRTVDSFAPAVAVRFRIWRGLGAELAATRSLAGEDRHLAVAVLRVTYRF